MGVINAGFLRDLWSVLEPDTQTIAYQIQTALGVYTTIGVDNAWWRPGGGTVEGGPSDGVYTKGGRDWYFPKSSYAGLPNIGDVITSTVTEIDPIAITSTIIGVNDVGALGAWELATISLQLQADLRGSLTFGRPNNAVDAAYRPAPTYTTFASNIPARVQPEGGEGKEVFDRITLPAQYTAFLGQTLALRAKDLAFDGTNYFTVKSFKMPDRITDLMEVTLEIIL